MKKYFFLIPIILVGCKANEPLDYVGVYEFGVIGNYIVVDTTILIDGLYGKEPITITNKKACPLRVDLFENAGQLSGQMILTALQKYDKQMGLLDVPIEEKFVLQNLHIVNDSLVFDLPKNIYIKSLKSNSKSLKLVKGKKDKLIVYSDEISNEDLVCCPNISFLNGVIVISSFDKSDLKTVNSEINSCLMERVVKKLEIKYGSNKSDHFRSILR